jgi:hypothetical protein
MRYIQATKKEIEIIKKRSTGSIATELWKRSPKGRKFTLLAKELIRRTKISPSITQKRIAGKPINKLKKKIRI